MTKYKICCFFDGLMGNYRYICKIKTDSSCFYTPIFCNSYEFFSLSKVIYIRTYLIDKGYYLDGIIYKDNKICFYFNNRDVKFFLFDKNYEGLKIENGLLVLE